MALFTVPRGIHLRLLLLPAIGLLACAAAAPLAAQTTSLRTGDMTVGRNLARGTLLPDGRVLITGGTSTGTAGSVFNTTADIYDPNTGAFTAVKSPMATPRIRHFSILLANGPAATNGQVLLIGGATDGSTTTASAELFNPATGTFTAAGSMGVPREQALGALLPNGNVLVVGGIRNNGDGTLSIFRTAEIYDPKAAAFTATSNNTTQLYGALASQAAVTLPGGKVLIVGAQTLTSGNLVPVPDIVLYDPTADTFTTIGQLNEGRINPAVTLLQDGTVLVSGGQVPNADSSAQVTSANLEVVDPATGKSTTVGQMSDSRVNHVAVALADGTVLLAGGATGASAFNGGIGDHSIASADIYDPKTKKITPTAPLTLDRTQAVAVLLKTGKVLIAGGAQVANKGTSARLSSAELVGP